GNISSYTLHFGTREEVIAETLSCMREAKRSRGIIVGVSNYVVPGTPRENIMAMLETIQKYRF
ncbi:uroporphyrinogen decarboxylase, partial [Candidatus Bathyarchaeota archaeon]|nr:uroporphyrinogen decarboxylase [Candidatus Bathyarchaeota archaeon]